MFYGTYLKIIRFGLNKYHIKKYTNGETKKHPWVYNKQCCRSFVWLDNNNGQREIKEIMRQWHKALFGVVRN